VLEVDVVEGGGVIAGIITRMVAGDIVEDGMASQGLGAAVNLGGGGVEVVWLKNL